MQMIRIYDKNITNKKNRDSKTETIIHDDPFDKHKDSVHVKEVVHNVPGNSLIVSDQVSNKIIHNSSNNYSLFGESIPKGINI